MGTVTGTAIMDTVNITVAHITTMEKSIITNTTITHPTAMDTHQVIAETHQTTAVEKTAVQPINTNMMSMVKR